MSNEPQPRTIVPLSVPQEVTWRTHYGAEQAGVPRRLYMTATIDGVDHYVRFDGPGILLHKADECDEHLPILAWTDMFDSLVEGLLATLVDALGEVTGGGEAAPAS